MAKDNQANTHLEEVPSNDTQHSLLTQSKNYQQQEKPFHVVLVDIKKAANDHYIHCVEKPLMGDEDLKFVALSYRWGEVQEETVDTRLGYKASITSFDLNHFYRLCKTITREIDLQAMEYVWVDAICVDQTNEDKRKATIYQMTNIYERANYIVAVPDLHLYYLKKGSKQNAEIIEKSCINKDYIYHLIHGNNKTLIELDKKWLDKIGVPKNPHLRHLLTKFTDNFALKFMKCIHHEFGYNDKYALDHIYATNPASRRVSSNRLDRRNDAKPATTADLDKLHYNNIHTCDTMICPLGYFDINDATFDGIFNDFNEEFDYKWKQAIPERGDSIRQSMYFLMYLIQDWSTRVWVISEIHIAKKKKIKKMKYWFIQLGDDDDGGGGNDDQLSFFEMGFGGTGTGNLAQELCADFFEYDNHIEKSNAVYQVFHMVMQRQLIQQRFLEKILKSKASRSEDRFHAILPNSEYRNKLISKDQVHQWNIRTLVSVKLQLYEWMTTKDKLELLMLSCNATNIGTSFPTFATSSIIWPEPDDYVELDGDTLQCNFDLDNQSTIELIQQQTNGNDCTYILNIKPRAYYRNRFLLQKHDMLESTMRSLPHLDLPNGPVDFIFIPRKDMPFHPGRMKRAICFSGFWYNIFLAGSFVKNKWIVFGNIFRNSYNSDSDWEFCRADDVNDCRGFNIY